MRITYVTETWPPDLNGVALTAARTVAWLRGAGHAVQLVRPRQRDEAARDDADEWRTLGCPVPMYPELRMGLASAHAFVRRWEMAARAAGAVRAVRAASDRLPPDLVHVATPGPLGHAALCAAALAGIPATADFRTNFHAYSRHYGFGWAEPVVLSWLRRLHARARLNFVPTAALADELAALGFARLAVLGRGVDARRFTPMRRDDALRLSWGAAPRDPVCLVVGRLAVEKNVALAFEAFERLRETAPRARLVVVGDGPLRAALEAAYSGAHPGAHPGVHFAGALHGDALARHYASADLFLFPSQTETFGNVVLEAMASGLALVAFDLAAAHQHARDGQSACLALPGSAASFVDAALRALAMADPEHPLRRAARRAALRADWDGILRCFEGQLLGVVAASAPHPGVPHAAVA